MQSYAVGHPVVGAVPFLLHSGQHMQTYAVGHPVVGTVPFLLHSGQHMQSYAVGHSVVYLADAVVQSGVIDVFAVLQHFGVLLFPVVGEYHLVLVVCEHESFYYPVLLFVVLFSAVQFLEMILEAAYFLVSQKVSQK
jgi:hypothetical protein